MSVTCKSVKHSELFVRRDGEVYRLSVPLHVECTCLVDKKKTVVVRFDFEQGFACDGLSVPSAFRWFLTNWDLKNDLYNIAGMVHDALYGNKGFYTFDRDECDAMFRGLLRESGCNRFHASAADLAVGLCAKSHWGDDSLHCRHLVTMSVQNINVG